MSTNVNSKLERVNPNPITSSYVRGTEPGNFYLILAIGKSGSVIGFRPLEKRYAEIGSQPGLEPTRVRLVPNFTITPTIERLILRLGFEKRQYGSSDPIHYSAVSSTPSTLVEDAELVLALLD